MAFTRAQASALLNKSEMRLFDDSRANALRGFDRAALASRVERTRAARDRARDLLKRQRLAARKRGDGRDDGIAARTARKEALLVELLQRFSDARREAPVKQAAAKSARKTTTKAAQKAVVKKVAAKKAVTKKAAAKKTVTKKAVTKKAAAKKAVVKKAVARKAVAKKAVVRATPNRAADTGATARKAVARKPAGKKPATRKAARRVSPERALENTRHLLEEKQARARSPQPWQSLDPVVDHAPQPGYQSPQAASKARELHAGESRMASIHGSSSTRDRYNQGKRDHRGDTE
ncbi:hypothetical protein GCM10007164_03230 [Luteimonas padinae]|uniref:TolA protein n=1 Tax=Luteimonas padinae TaxID=1714359 RepID=A0ABV6SXB0_9GAMM|nr:hypothetical protein GCM10007164_03230 [Luteimonas padinae]